MGLGKWVQTRNTRTVVDSDVLISELDGQVVIQISGDLDLPFRLAHADELKEVVKRHHAREVAIDCSRAEFVDLAGFSCFVSPAVVESEHRVGTPDRNVALQGSELAIGELARVALP